MLHKSIVIIGGGPVGLSLALSIAKQGKQVTLIDRGIDKSSDGRVLALSYASYTILNNLRAWPQSDLTTAINTVQISHKGLGVSQINAKALGLECLGYTVSYAHLCDSLTHEVQQNQLIDYIVAEVSQINDGAGYACVQYKQADEVKLITCDLLILAEGGRLLASINHKKIDYDYAQQALIFHIKTKVKPNGVAHERFAGSGPLVLLPFKDHYVVVWSLNNSDANYYKQHTDTMIAQLNTEFTRRLGSAELISPVVTFPLRLIQTSQRLHERTVIIGNSAQVVHPVSAQGLNLGLRDVLVLSELLAKGDKVDLTLLAEYDSVRQKDVNAVIGFTHFLATKMETNNQLLAHLRGAGIIGLSNLPFAQNIIARSLIFGI